MCKNQKISLHFSRVSSPHPSTAKRKKKWKGILWFCFAVSVSEKSTIILSCLIALFSALTATEALPYPRLVVTLESANPHNRLRLARSLRSHWLLQRCVCSLGGFVCVCGGSKKPIVLWHKQIYICLLLIDYYVVGRHICDS